MSEKRANAQSGPVSEPAVVSLGASHSPLFALVTDKLRERILNGQYEPGERLVENKLSSELGVSRIPVREALRSLATEGWW